ncbi:MAG: lumenal Hsp70 protein [Geoglossum umbratile]|nr:MAG: lumenal Hsp70 protein [Geoglossum umbratile]
MAPMGRRRAPALLFTIALSVLLFVTASSAASAVIGIDLGTEYIKAVIVKPGIPLKIVLTKDSKRKESAAVAFKTPQGGSLPERVYGSEAVVLGARFPDDVYPNLKPLLGVPFKDSGIANEYSGRHPALSMIASGNRGTVAFKSKALGEDAEPLVIEELLAMELQNVMANAGAAAGKGTHAWDAIITVPPFYTTEEKRAVELAADLAGLRVLGLISDGLAVGLNYATTRTFPSISDGGKPEIHLVYDMGAGSTKATILRFQGRVVKDVGKFNKTIQEVDVLGTGWDRTLGGDALNAVLVDHLLDEFVKIPKVKKLGLAEGSQGLRAQDVVKRNGRVAAKLWKEAERVRQVLSANSETMASIESLFEDIDFRLKITRTEFEGLTSPYAKRLSGPIERALESARLKIADIGSIILHGGAVRTPFVQKQLEGVVGDADKVRGNVNRDEAAAFGAAFKAAGLVPNFRVKEIRTGEEASYAVSAHWASDDEKDRIQILFIPTSKTGVEKQIPFKKLGDFSFTLHQSLPKDEQPGESGFRDVPILAVQTQNLTQSVSFLQENSGCASSDIKTEFSIRLSLKDGQPEIIHGSVSCEVEVLAEKKGVVDDVKGFFGFGSRKGDQEPLASGSDGDPSGSTEQASSATTSSSAETPSSSHGATADEKPTAMSKKTERIYLKFTASVEGMPEPTQSQLEQVKERLAALDKSDRDRRLREEARNNVEAFMYKYRDLLDDGSFVEAGQETELDMLRAQIQLTDEWLNGSGADADLAALETRLRELNALVAPIDTRLRETSKRPAQIQLLKGALEQTKTLIEAMKAGIESQEAASSSSSVSSASSAETTRDASIDNDFAELEDEATSSDASTTSTSSAKTQTSDVPPPFPKESIARLEAFYESIEKWLADKVKAQETRKINQDPAVQVREIEDKLKELTKFLMDELQGPLPEPSSSSSTPKAKAKTSKPKAKKAKSTKSKTSKPARSSKPKSAEKATPLPVGDFGDLGEDDIPVINLGDDGQIEYTKEHVSGGEKPTAKHDEL